MSLDTNLNKLYNSEGTFLLSKIIWSLSTWKVIFGFQ